MITTLSSSHMNSGLLLTQEVRDMDKVSKLVMITLFLKIKNMEHTLLTIMEAIGDMRTIKKSADKNGHMTKFPIPKSPSSHMLASTHHAMVIRSTVTLAESKAGKNSNSTKLALAQELDCLKETNALLSRLITVEMVAGYSVMLISGFGATEIQLLEMLSGVDGTMAQLETGL